MPITTAKVKLIGADGNAFVLLALVRKAMTSAKVEQPVVEAFMKEATSGDYAHLLQTITEYVEVT